jgi:hypothetical protein
LNEREYETLQGGAQAKKAVFLKNYFASEKNAKSGLTRPIECLKWAALMRPISELIDSRQNSQGFGHAT